MSTCPFPKRSPDHALGAAKLEVDLRAPTSSEVSIGALSSGDGVHPNSSLREARGWRRTGAEVSVGGSLNVGVAGSRSRKERGVFRLPPRPATLGPGRAVLRLTSERLIDRRPGPSW